VENFIETLKEQQKWEKLWDLIFKSTPHDAAKIIDILKNSGWSPSGNSAQLWNKLITAYPNNGFFLEPIPSLIKMVNLNVGKADKCKISIKNNILLFKLVKESKNNDAFSLIQNFYYSLSGTYKVTYYLDVYRILNNNYDIEPLYSKDININVFEISEDGELLILGTEEGSLSSFYLMDGKLIRVYDGPAVSVTSIYVSKDKKLLFAGYADNKIIQYNLSTGEIIHIFEGPYNLGSENRVLNILLSPDEKVLITTTGPEIYLWNMADGSLIKKMKKHIGTIEVIKVTSDGKLIVTGSATGTIDIWNLINKKLIYTLKGHNDWIESLDITPDNNILITADKYYKKIILWNLLNGQMICKLEAPGRKTSFINISEDGTTFLGFNTNYISPSTPEKDSYIFEYKFYWCKSLEKANVYDLEFVRKILQNKNNGNLQSWRFLEVLLSGVLENMKS